jgi:hypothetical protein
VFWLGCDCCGVLPLPAPAEQTQRAEAGGKERKGGGKWRTASQSGASLHYGDIFSQYDLFITYFADGTFSASYFGGVDIDGATPGYTQTVEAANWSGGGTYTVTPLPTALPLFATGLGALTTACTSTKQKLGFVG